MLAFAVYTVMLRRIPVLLTSLAQFTVMSVATSLALRGNVAYGESAGGGLWNIAFDGDALVTFAQTTLSHHDWAGVLDATRDRFPELWMPGRSDLCFATTNRQSALQHAPG